MQSGKLGNYYPVSSLIHKLNPIVKLVCFFLFLFLIWIVKEVYLEFLFLLILIVTAFLSLVPMRFYLKLIWKMKYLFFGMFLLGLFCHYEFVVLLLFLMRLLNLIFLSSILLYTTKKRELIYGMEFLLTPLISLKIPVRSIIMMISLSLQFIPNLFLEMEKIIKSLMCRGMDYHYASKEEKWEIIKATVNPMFVYTFKKADCMSDVMELRGYQVEEKRTHYDAYPFRWFDYCYLLLHVILLIFVVVKGVL